MQQKLTCPCVQFCQLLTALEAVLVLLWARFCVLRALSCGAMPSAVPVTQQTAAVGAQTAGTCTAAYQSRWQHYRAATVTNVVDIMLEQQLNGTSCRATMAELTRNSSTEELHQSCHEGMAGCPNCLLHPGCQGKHKCTLAVKASTFT